ncbi:hypothetical protein GW915_13520 [bacterium]|nr:hypothetical protein [bacterium]
MGRRKMEPQRKSVAALVSLGCMTAILAAVVFEKTFASGDDRIVRKDDRNTSSLKNPVPMSREMSAKLNEKQAELEEKEKALAELQERLEVEESRVQEKINQLVSIQKKLEKSKEEDQKIRKEVKEKLVKTFEKMSPKKAAPVISTMEDDIAVELLLSMKEKSVASILESMSADRAMTISSLIAGRGPASKLGKEGQSLP